MKVKETGYLFLTFLISWGMQLVLILTNHTQDGIFNAVYPMIMLTPALAVLATKYAIKEPLWVDFWLKPDGRKTILYSIIGWLGPVALIALGAVVFFLIFPEQFDSGMTAQIAYLREGASDGLKEFSDKQIVDTLKYQIVLNIILAPFYNFLICVGEEVGWRGYYLQMLCDKYPKWKAVLINGTVWGIWYFPMVIGMDLFYGRDYVGYPFVGCIATLIYCIVLGTIYAFLTIRTQSCIPAIFANGCLASMSGVATLFLKDSSSVSVFLNPMPTSIIGGIGFIIVAGIIWYFLVKDKVQPAEQKVEVDLAYVKKKRGN